ncbi:MAG TPA: hypothetical protein VMY06_12890 [Sedimentisphaerales bacterium]|nr:hypothetical protein [Sedimentisphaerales bacterium]
MPFTPYHLGPSGFIGLTLRKWIDIPVFVLANVVVDVEVLVIRHFGLGYPLHRYTHTLLLGAVAGLIWAVAAYPLRNFFKKIMRILHIPYQTSFWKMLVSGVLGVWLHVVIDAIYHPDVRLFRPAKAIPLYALLTRQQIQTLCLVFFIAAVVLWALAAVSYSKRKIKESANNGKD